MASKPSNILFIQTDQLVASALSMYGNMVCKTPNLDRLAQSGVVFENAYCNYPLCAPSRFSMASGMLASRIGAFDNGCEFPASIPTYAHYLRKNGYQTTLSGKMHFVGPDQLHGFERRLTTDIYPADFQWAANWKETTHQDVSDARMFKISGPCVNTAQLEYDTRVVFEAQRYLYQIAQQTESLPFFLQVSLTHPHDPYLCKQEYWDLYENVDIPLPHVNADMLEDRDPHSEILLRQSGLVGNAPSDDEIKRVRRSYFGTISFIDDKIGELLQVLDNTGLSDNTAIIFTSDHGEMLGERGMWLKKNFFEPSIKVPLLIHAPHLWQSKRVKDVVSLVDILPTLVAISSESDDEIFVDNLDGVNLSPLMNKATAESKRPLFAEITCEGTPAPLFMIRDGKYKFIYCDDYPDQLYNLDNDEFELKNLATNPAVANICNDMQQQVLKKWNTSKITEQVKLSQSRRQLINSALINGEKEPWDYVPKYNDSHLFRGATTYNDWAYSPLLKTSKK